MKKHDVTFREAISGDIDKIVALLADDDLGKLREELSDRVADCYVKAFNKIDLSPDNELIVMAIDKDIVGCMQLTFIPYLTFKGGIRCLIEGVRVSASHRGQGLGEKMFQFAIKRAKNKDCHMVQLTTNKKRPDAYSFYEKLGFKATHEGFKLYLKEESPIEDI